MSLYGGAETSCGIVRRTAVNAPPDVYKRQLLDQRKYMNKFDQIQALLGLTEKEKSQILSINMANNPSPVSYTHLSLRRKRKS